MIFQSYSTCNKRSYQEDYLFIKNNLNTDQEFSETENFSRLKINVFGVFDGHGGSDISCYLNTELPNYFYKQNIITNNIPKPNNAYSEYILSTFNDIHNNLSKTNINSNTQGSTVCICCIYYYKTKLCITSTWIGDSRAVACNQYLIAESLTLDHKPNDILEKFRIEALGGTVTNYKDDTPRINGILAVSRSFGDADQNPYVISLPEVIHRLCAYKFIVVATDGLWDVMSNQDVVNFILEYIFINSIKLIKESSFINENNIAYLLCKKAIELGSGDNISIIICFIDTQEEHYKKYLKFIK